MLEWSGDFALLAEFIAIFKHEYLQENQSIRVNPFQVNSHELYEDFTEFVNTYSRCIPKKIYLFQRFLKSLPRGHFFLIVFGIVDSTEKLKQYFDRLREINDKQGFKVDKVAYTESALNLLKKYNLSFYGHQRRLVGAEGPHKLERVCRFCRGQNGKVNKTGNLVSFRNKAHVIPESLGNKKLVSFDECDNCNNKFGRGIEQSLVEYFSVFRAFNEIKGKGGKKKLVGKDFVYHPETGFEIKYSGNIDANTQSLNFRLETNSSFVPQDVYRSLVKLAINVLDNSELAKYQKTVIWVNGDFSARFLPKIMIAQGHSLYVNEPMLIIYKRKMNENGLPNVVCEFRFVDISLCFIVPFSNSDSKTFVKRKDFKNFWQHFDGIKKNITWYERSFSSKKIKKTVIDFRMEGLKFRENFFFLKV